MSKPFIVIIGFIDTLLLLVSGAILAMVMLMSIMIFDSGESWQAWAMFAGICAVCLLLGGAAIYCTRWCFKKKRYLLSMLGSAIPLIAFAGLQLLA